MWDFFTFWLIIQLWKWRCIKFVNVSSPQFQWSYEWAHIWACPPSEGDDYIFHCHPPEQKIPKPKRLQDWYKKMLDKAVVDKVVAEYKVSEFGRERCKLNSDIGWDMIRYSDESHIMFSKYRWLVQTYVINRNYSVPLAVIVLLKTGLCQRIFTSWRICWTNSPKI